MLPLEFIIRPYNWIPTIHQWSVVQDQMAEAPPSTTPRNNYRRYNPLLDEWIIVAANRVNRPWGVSYKSKSTVGFQIGARSDSLH